MGEHKRAKDLGDIALAHIEKRHKTIEILKRVYAVDSVEALVEAQAVHIAELQLQLHHKS